MQQRLNELKDREDFRPVAPVVTEEAVGEWFEGGSALALHALHVSGALAPCVTAFRRRATSTGAPACRR